MNIDNKTLIEELKTYTSEHQQKVNTYQSLSDDDLHFRESDDRWSLLENIEHLNRYAQFYIPEIEKALPKLKPATSSIFKSGRLGNYFALSMLPGSEMKTMNTFKSKNPLGASLGKETLATFQNHLHRLQNLLNSLQGKDLGSVKTYITIPLLKIKLGDTLRVVIYHHERHIVQIEKIRRYQKANPTSKMK